MAEVKWIKLSVHMFDDEKIRLIEGMPEGERILLIWVRLLSLAGKCNASGYIYLSKEIPYTEEMLASLFNKPLNTIRLALSTLQKFGMVDVDEDLYIYISNWEKHQSLDKAERINFLTHFRIHPRYDIA